MCEQRTRLSSEHFNLNGYVVLANDKRMRQLTRSTNSAEAAAKQLKLDGPSWVGSEGAFRT